MLMRSGLLRKIDSLGRVSIPSEIRHSLNLQEGDTVEFGVSGHSVYFERYNTVCFVCGEDKDVETVEVASKTGKKRFNICYGCRLQINNLNKEQNEQEQSNIEHIIGSYI